MADNYQDPRGDLASLDIENDDRTRDDLVEGPPQSLFRIEQGLANLIAAREECETDEERQAFDVQIREYVAAEIRKVDGIASYRLMCKARISEIQGEIDRLIALQSSWMARESRINEATMYAMQSFGEKRLEGATHAVRVQANGGLAPLVINNPELIPAHLQTATVTMSVRLLRSICRDLSEVECREIYKTVTEPDNERIREALKGTETVPGAHLGPRGEHLRWL